MELFSKLGTFMATTYFIRSIVKEYLPPELYEYFTKLLQRLTRFFTSYITIVIEEYEGGFYEAVQIYLSTRSSSSANRLRLNKLKNAKEFTFTMDKNEEIEDKFEGITLRWLSRSREIKQQMFSWDSISDERRSFELKFHKRDKTKVLDVYLPHVMAQAKLLELKARHRKIYTNKSGSKSYERMWTPVVFDHPATFETLALDPEMKDDIVRDLKKFSQRENYYRKVGRAWKRGYLLYGPPGTGKSSMIAAMANFLDYDIYDLELTEVKSNNELRKLLIATTNKSIIVIEDIDCSLDLSDRKTKPKKEKTEDETPGGSPEKAKAEAENQESKVTLSGVLNFTDGLWSCCGGERIIIFTTNHVDRLDPALLRSGRMDKHIHLSFCGFSAFKVLARNYLGLEYHPLFQEVETLLNDAQITPSDVGEEMMRASDDPSSALEKLIEALKMAKEKAATAKNEAPNVNEETSLVTEESSMAGAVPITDGEIARN